MRELLGDLVVATVELGETSPRPSDFAGWYALAERWLRLASETAAGITSSNSDEGDAELLAALRDAVAGVVGSIRVACEYGMPSASWEQACVTRSGLEALRELGIKVDTADLETLMVRHGRKAHERVVPPEGTPAFHWWWYGSAPAYERTLQMNERMKSHLPLVTPDVSPAFRDKVADGFMIVDGGLFFQGHAPDVPMTELATAIECTRNGMSVEHYLPRDPSRRPVDLAGAALACAQHLAFELRRHPYGVCRIIVTVRQLTSTLRFHQVRPGQSWLTRPLERYEDALLTMDTA